MARSGWTLGLTDAARAELRAIGRPVSREIGAALNGLLEHPQRGNIRKLKGYADLYRLRIGDYRAIFRRDPAMRRYVVLTVRSRDEAYKR